MMFLSDPNRPRLVDVALLLLCTPLVAAILIMIGSTLFSDPRLFNPTSLSLPVVLFAPLLFVVYRITQRDNVARWMLTGIISMIAISGLYSVFFQFQPSTNTVASPTEYAAILSLVSILMLAVGAALLHLPTARHWFQEGGSR